ncbi:unnamed protein product, partial [Discosporangium mesarthrocarpum]
MSEGPPPVTLTEVTHRLYYVDSLENIETGPITNKDVPAWELKNNVGMSVKAMAEGGNMVQVSKNGVDYVWDNVEGATYYGANSNSFPLTRGLILHGGIRFAAVSAEHGLYYDTDWDVSFLETADGLSKSIVFSIVDTQEQRDALNDPGSIGQFSRSDQPFVPLSNYPVSNMKYTYTITLNADEEYVRLNMAVENPTSELARAEAWLPQTYPIDSDSQIISPQRKRWRRDPWCFPDSANLVDCNTDELLHPLRWNTSIGGIYYDWPTMDGGYHAVNKPSEGRGVAYVTDPRSAHFTKLWSWGKPELYDRDEALAAKPPLAAGRPVQDYYEPWGSAFNMAFFQTSEFQPFTRYSWSAAIMPIESGMEDADQAILRRKVEQRIAELDVQV